MRRCGSAEDGPEFEPLKAGEGWPFHVDHLDQMPVLIHKYSGVDVDAILQEHAGIITSGLTTIPDSTADLIYLPEYDAFCHRRRCGTDSGKTETGRYLFRTFLPPEGET